MAARRYSGFIEKVVKPFSPLIVVCLLSHYFDDGSLSIVSLSVTTVNLLILWFCWPLIRRNRISKIVGVLYVIALGLVFALMALAVTLGAGMILLILLFFATPIVIYDLFFHLPRKGLSNSENSPT